SRRRTRRDLRLEGTTGQLRVGARRAQRGRRHHPARRRGLTRGASSAWAPGPSLLGNGRCSSSAERAPAASPCRTRSCSNRGAGYFGAGALEAGTPGRRNTTGASAGTLNGVADLGSESNLENVPGLSLKCFSSVVIRVVLAG